VCNVTPTSGILAPLHTQQLNVSFRPRAFMGFTATVIFSVLGGPSRSLRISGHSARHVFSISSTLINFGFKQFMEPCQETFKISNMSQLPIRFNITHTMNDIDVEDLEVGKLTVLPNCGKIEPKSSASVIVTFLPGMGGEFEEVITVQVGYLEPVVVVVTGYGVPPQVTLNQPRISKPRVPIEWMYSAVASLTSKRFSPLFSVHQCSPDVNIVDYSFQDWVLISHSDSFPSNDDIWLAIERVIAYHLIKENPLDLSRKSKSTCKTIPQLAFPGYVYDFGSVIFETMTEATLIVENRGFVHTDVHLAPSAVEKLKKDGFFY